MRTRRRPELLAPAGDMEKMQMAVAYGAEILMLTHFFQKKAPLQEMLMPYLFGILYVALGLGYLLGH